MLHDYVKRMTQLSTALTEILCRGWVRQNMDPCQPRPRQASIVAIRQDGRSSIGRQSMSMTSRLNLTASFQNLDSSNNTLELGRSFARHFCDRELRLE